MEEQKIAIYQDDSGDLKVSVQFHEKDLWLNQKQIGELYGREKATINEHIKVIFSDGEHEEKATVRKFLIVQKE